MIPGALVSSLPSIPGAENWALRFQDLSHGWWCLDLRSEPGLPNSCHGSLRG